MPGPDGISTDPNAAPLLPPVLPGTTRKPVPTPTPTPTYTPVGVGPTPTSTPTVLGPYVDFWARDQLARETAPQGDSFWDRDKRAREFSPAALPIIDAADVAADSPGPVKRAWRPIGEWFGKTLGPGAYAKTQQENWETVQTMSVEQQKAVGDSVMWAVVGANSPAAFPATIRPAMAADRKAHELGVTQKQYDAGMMHSLVYSEAAMQRNIIYSSLAAAPLVMAATPIAAAALGGGALATTGGLLLSGLIGAASSLPFTLLETGSPFGHGGGELTRGEVGLLGLDIGSDLLLKGLGKYIFKPAAKGVRKGADSLLSESTRSKAQGIIAREFDKVPQTVEERAASTRITQLDIMDKHLTALHKASKLDARDAHFRGDFTLPGTEKTVSYGLLVRRHLQQQGLYTS